MIPAGHIHPNPDQPRQRIGSVDALADSIRDHGLIQPILVRRLGNKDFQIIAGERRYRAAMKAGMREIPCIERDTPRNESLELALVENLLRDDLTPFEEAAAYRNMLRDHGHTHESLARRVGKSRTSVTETLALLNIPEELREMCWAAGIRSRRKLLRVAREASPEAMAECVRRIASGVTATPKKRKATRKKRARPFVFRYAPRNAPFRLQMTFRRSAVEEAEVIQALRDLLKQLESRRSGEQESSAAGNTGPTKA